MNSQSCNPIIDIIAIKIMLKRGNITTLQRNLILKIKF